VVALVTAVALLLVPAGASAASPVLEFVVPGHSFPISFTTEGGAVTAQMAGFQTLVHCTASSGEGEITGARSTVSKYRFTGCTAAGGAAKCKSTDAKAEEIVSEEIAGDLVYIDQAKDQVGILLNPEGHTYISFECGGESAEGQGSFVAPVGPINQEASVFTATLSQLDSVQVPAEYEGEKGEQLQAIPTGRRESNPFVPTGVELAMTIHSSVPGEIKAVTAQQIEANQHEEEAKQLQASLKKQEEALKTVEEHIKRLAEENAQLTAAAKKAQEEAAKKKLEETHPKYSHPPTRTQVRLGFALHQCEKLPKSRRARCVAKAHQKYGPTVGKGSRH
jgi:hypothetical protein